MTKKQSRYEIYQGFFAAQANGEPFARINAAKLQANKFDTEHYSDEVYTELGHIEREAQALYQIFKDSQHQRQKLAESGLIEMLAFTSQLLAIHYQSYAKQDKSELYQKWLTELEAFAQNGVVADDNSLEKSNDQWLLARIHWLMASVKAQFTYLWNLLCHPSLLRDQFNLTNITRVYWIFCHFCLNQMMILVRDTDVLDKIGQLLGQPIDLDGFYNALNMPNDTSNILSVVFFAGRLVIDLCMIAKHTYGANEDERRKTTAKQRFLAELDKRFLDMANEVVWGGVNLVTNYNYLFGIPNQWVFPIIAGVLIFDVFSVMALYSREHSAYMQSLENIECQINALEEQDPYRQVLLKQRDYLSEQWQIKEAIYQFNGIAAVSFFSSFTISLMLTPPAAILACYLVCCLGVAMYSSNAEYSQYLKASNRLANAQSRQGFNALELQQLADAKDQAFQNFYTALAERTLAPIAIFSLIGLCPVAGLTVAAGYIAYKLEQAYKQSEQKSSNSVSLNQFSLFSNGDNSAADSSMDEEEAHQQIASLLEQALA